MFDEGQFHIADFGRGNAQQRKYSASKSDLLFFADLVLSADEGFFCRSKRK
jgi:hypothetical protein